MRTGVNSEEKDTEFAGSVEEEHSDEKTHPVEKTVKKQFPVTGMSCASCASNVELNLSKQRGVVKSNGQGPNPQYI